MNRSVEAFLYTSSSYSHARARALCNYLCDLRQIVLNRELWTSYLQTRVATT